MIRTKRADRAFVEKTYWGFVYQGTRAQLVEAGVMRTGEFPGEPGRPPCAYDAGDGRRITRRNYRRGRPVDERTYFAVYVDAELGKVLHQRDAGYERFKARVLEPLQP